MRIRNLGGNIVTRWCSVFWGSFVVLAVATLVSLFI